MYPCKDCLVSIVCNEDCDELITDQEILINLIHNKQCPDCGSLLMEEYLHTGIHLVNDYYYCTNCRICYTHHKHPDASKEIQRHMKKMKEG